MTVTVKVTESTTGQKVIGQKVQLLVEPSRKDVSCKSYKLKTNSNGVATTLCQLKKAGAAKITARAAGLSVVKTLQVHRTS